jgi:hypothetical protein
MIMTNSDNINSALGNWREMKLAQTDSSQTEHLKEQILVRMAADGGLQEALESELKHLDNCPLCLASWSAWRRAFTVAQECNNESEKSEEFSSESAYGFLEAAATTSAKATGQIVESRCGTYRLEIMPNRDDPTKGMIVLSSRPAKSDNKGGNQVTVRDRNGRIIISGTLENKKLARLCHNLDEIDLTVWTIS